MRDAGQSRGRGARTTINRPPAAGVSFLLVLVAGLITALRETALLVPEAAVIGPYLNESYVGYAPLLLLGVAGIVWLAGRRTAAQHIHPATYAARKRLDIFAPPKAATAGAFTFSTRPGLAWIHDDEGIAVTGIVVRARNDGDVPVALTGAQIVSEKMGDDLAVRVRLPDGLVLLEELDAVPAGAEIHLEATLPKDGLREEPFRRSYGAFSLIVEYGGDSHRHVFERDFVDESLRSLRPRPSAPAVTRKAVAAAASQAA